MSEDGRPEAVRVSGSGVTEHPSLIESVLGIALIFGVILSIIGFVDGAVEVSERASGECTYESIGSGSVSIRN